MPDMYIAGQKTYPGIVHIHSHTNKYVFVATCVYRRFVVINILIHPDPMSTLCLPYIISYF